MADTMTPEQRHRCMSRIRGKDTRPELLVRRYLYAHGFRYRLHERRLPGRPDIVIRRLHTVIMVNGCFWHGHEDCSLFRLPQTRRDFWEAKITRNRSRDLHDREALHALGWNVITLWECQLRPATQQATLQSLVLTLSQIELQLAARRPSIAPQAPVVPYRFDDDAPAAMVADDTSVPYTPTKHNT